MTFDVRACREAAARRLARETPRSVHLDGADFTTLAAALTHFHENGGGPMNVHEKFDHQLHVEQLADKLGVTLGHWTKTDVAVPRDREQREAPAPMVIEHQR